MHLTNYTKIQNNKNKTNKNTGDLAPCGDTNNSHKEWMILYLQQKFHFRIRVMFVVFVLISSNSRTCMSSPKNAVF